MGWYEAVAAFSSRELTFSRDKLPALSGIARYIWDPIAAPTMMESDGTVSEKMLRQEYLAGLWKGDIHRGLLWRCSPSAAFRQHRAPSWSWAVMDGKISWDEFFVTVPCADILEARVSTATSDATGSVTVGHLVIRGYTHPVGRYQDLKPQNSTGGYCALTWSQPRQRDRGDHIALPLVTHRDNSGGYKGNSVAGLILQATGNIENGVGEYQRIGTFRIAKKPGLGVVGSDNLHFVFDTSDHLRRTVRIV